MAILEVKNLKKNFGELEVLKGIDFSLEKGDVMAVIGSSGNGKTTLLRCINFLETPNEGEIIVNGETLFDASQKENASESDIRKKRAKHAVYENQRAIRAVEALKANDVDTFGKLMNASHVSLRDDYEVSCEEIDILVDLAWETEGVIGSRITGG